MKVDHYYTARRVATQSNAAGGAIIVDISPATGQTFELIDLRVANSGNNTLSIYKVDEDNADAAPYGGVGAAATNVLSLPSFGSVASNSGNLIDSRGARIVQGQKLTCRQANAGAQNDTMTIAVTLKLTGSKATPTWSKARSTNEADVALATSTITAANTDVVVREPT